MTEQLIETVAQKVVKQVVKELSNYQKYYMHYTWNESIAMTIIAACSNFMSVPIVVQLFKRQHNFAAIMCLFSTATSFLYHFCEIYDCKLFLDFSSWHRLDNVFAVTCMSLYMIYLTGNMYHENLVYSTLMVAILAQQKDPWNLNYTIWPIIGFAIVGIISNIHYKIGVPEYRYDQLLKGSLLLMIGAYFFVKGLDEHTDYLRLNHGIWHFFLGWASFYNMNSVASRFGYEQLHQKA